MDLHVAHELRVRMWLWELGFVEEEWNVVCDSKCLLPVTGGGASLGKMEFITCIWSPEILLRKAETRSRYAITCSNWLLPTCLVPVDGGRSRSCSYLISPSVRDHLARGT